MLPPQAQGIWRRLNGQNPNADPGKGEAAKEAAAKQRAGREAAAADAEWAGAGGTGGGKERGQQRFTLVRPRNLFRECLN